MNYDTYVHYYNAYINDNIEIIPISERNTFFTVKNMIDSLGNHVNLTVKKYQTAYRLLEEELPEYQIEKNCRTFLDAEKKTKHELLGVLKKMFTTQLLHNFKKIRLFYFIYMNVKPLLMILSSLTMIVTFIPFGRVVFNYIQLQSNAVISIAQKNRLTGELLRSSLLIGIGVILISIMLVILLSIKKRIKKVILDFYHTTIGS